jgi:hypothetical protein
MKLRHLVLFVAALLPLFAANLHGAEAPKLETLLAEYKKARADVLSKLNESYASQADELAKQYQAIPNLDGADRSRQFAKRLRNPDENNELPGISADEKSTDPFTVLQSHYVSARAANLKIVYTFYSTTAENLRRELLRTNDQAGADVMTTFLAKIKPASATPTAKAGAAKTRKTATK